MNGVELTRQQGGMGLPFGFSGNVEFMVDEGIAGGGGGGGGIGGGGGGAGGGLAKSPWPVLPTTPSPNALHKMLAELSYGPHLKTDIAPTSGHFGPLQPPSFPRFSDHLVNPISYSATNWVQQLQGTLPTECYNGFGSSGPKDSVRHYSQHITLNGGSLVLDTARGELVNASKMTPKEILEAKALAASKSHSEAERRRRERINTHLATLRTLLPSSTKTDKASLLAEVIDQVKTLKHQVSEIYEYGPMPTDHDELSVEKVSSSAEGRILIRASLCCDDRPDLMTDLRDALDTLRLRTLKAEISTLGGRIKNVFIVTLKEDTEDLDQDISKRMKEALKLVMDGPGSGELSPGSSNKRQRVSSFESPGCT